MASQPHHNFSQSFFEQLEERVLFDGVPDGVFITPELSQPEGPPAQTQSFDQAQNQSNWQTELIIIDSALDDGQALLSSLVESKPGTSFEVYFIDPNEDGVHQITERLSSTDRKFEAIHVLTHGEAGSVELGSTSLSLSNISRYKNDLGIWANSLTADADLLFYGCDLASNQSGQELLEIVSLITEADVAASTDLTGDSSQNANWQLEFTSGQIETLALSATNWRGTLAVEATDGIVSVEDAEFSGSGTVSLSNDGNPEVVTVLNTPTRVGQMLERVWTFNETVDVGRSTFVFDVNGVSGINATIASEFGLIISDQPDLADGSNTTTLVASGYDAVNGLVYFHQVDLNSGDYFGLATEVVLDNFSISPTTTGLEDTPIDLGLELSDSLTEGGPLRDVIATEVGYRDSSAGTTSTDFLIPAGTTGIKITGYSTRDIGTAANNTQNDDYQFLYASIDLGTETSNGYIGHLIDQGPARSDQFGWDSAPLGSAILTGGGNVTGDADDNINPNFTIVDGVLMITENHQLQTAYHVEFLTNATSSAEFIQTASAVLEDLDQSDASIGIPANADFLVINIADAATSSDSRVEYKGNSRIYVDLATLNASGVVSSERGETDTLVLNYGFEDYDVSSAAVGTILSAAGTIVGDTASNAATFNDNQIYVDASGNLIINRNNNFATNFNSLITVEYYERKDAGSSAEQLGESTAYGLWDSDPSNPTSILEFDIPENAQLGILNLTANGTRNNDTNENMGAAFAVIDLVNGTSSGSIYMVRTGNKVDLVGWDGTDFGTAFFDDPNSTSNHNTISNFNDPFAGTATFNLTNGGDTLELAANSDSGGSQTFLDYYAGGQIEWFGAAPFEISGFTNGGSFSQGTLNPTTMNWELTIADALAGLAYIPATHVSGTMPVDVTLRIGDESELTSVTVQAVIDPIDFSTAPDACGDEDTDIPISSNITPVFVDQDGSETLTSQVLSNIPIGHTLTDGTNSFTSTAGNQSVDITAWDATAINYRANPEEFGTFTITMDVNWQDVGGGVTDTDSVTTTFDVIVKPVNDAPVAVDDFYTVLGNTPLNINAASGVLNSDSDVDGDTLSATGVTTAPTNGSVTLNADGSFTYIPNMGFSGTDSFDYEVIDGEGGTATATAFIDVSEPVTGPLDAMDDAVTTDEETLINIDVTNNDDLPITGAFNIQSTTPPSNGSITVLSDGTIDYTPDVDFFGTDTFTYTLADASGRTSTATVTVTVMNVQDPPTANADSGSTLEDTTLPNIDILANDSDPDNDMLTVTGATAPNGTVGINPAGTINYTPAPGFFGTDTVSYTISDGNGGFDSSTVLINVVPVADPPTSADNTVTTDEDIAYTFSTSEFAFADQDPIDALIAVRIDSLPADGQLLINGNPATVGQVLSVADIDNGSLIFVPDPDGNGTSYTTFDFSVSDGILFQSTPNTMTISVIPTQDPPIATNNTITVNEDSTGNPLGLATPTDVDGDTLTATVTGLPTLGTVFLANGMTQANNGDMLSLSQLTSLVYDAPTSFTVSNAGSFTYDVTDGIDTDSGQIDITITAVNDPPTIDLNGGAAGEDYADTFTEGGSPVGIVSPTAEVTDDDDTTLPLLKFDFDESSIVDAGVEFLTIGGVDFPLDAAANSTTAVTVNTISYDVSFTAATASFDIARTDGMEMTLAEVEVILLNATYRNDSTLPTVGDRFLEVCVNDGDTDSNLATTTITVARDAETAEWSISGPATVVDGNNATYVVELSDPLRSGETALVDLVLMDIDTNAADLDLLNTAVSAAVASYSGPGSLAWDGTTLEFTSDGLGAMGPLSIVLPTTPDGVYEGDKDFKIGLSNPASTTGETISIDPTADEVITTIIDDTPAPTISIGDGSATEGSPIEFTITLDIPSFEDITLDLAAAAGSATAGTDFETTNFEYFDGSAWVAATAGTQITIPAGQTLLMVQVDSVQDGDVEPDEIFSLSATVVSGTVTSANDTGTGTIINDDNTLISIDDVSVDEDNGTMNFTVSLDQSPTSTVSVDYATASGSATIGVDFTAASGTITFTPGVQTQSITVAITDDNIYEGPHSFDVNLTNAIEGTIDDGLGVGTIFDNGAGPNGTDDDRPMISIDNVISTETVDTHAVFTISLSNPSVEDIDLSLTLVDVSATNPADYGPGLEFFDGIAWQPATGNVTIAANTTSVQVRTPIIDDPIADNNETYSLIATRVSGTTLNSSVTGAGTILDDNDPTLVSLSGDTSVTEGDTANYSVSLTNTPLTDVTVTFTYTGTASNGIDYTGVASVAIPAGSTTGTFSIPTIDDSLGEPLENFTVSINSVTGGSLEGLQIDSGSFEITTDIIDDDTPNIFINDVIVTEGIEGFAEFTVELSNPTFEVIGFDISAVGLSADGDAIDFGIIGVNELEVFDGTIWTPATTASFAVGETSIFMRTPISEDVFAEGAETFEVTVTTSGGGTNNTSDTGLGTIIDDSMDPETVHVSLVGPPTVVEGATTGYTLVLAEGMGLPVNAASDVTVTLVYSGTAADGSDFNSVATVVIPTGDDSATFTLSTIDDSTFESAEDIVITIDTVTGGGFEGTDIDATADTVTTSIIDTADTPTVLVNHVTAIEGTDNYAVFTVELSYLSVESISVDLALADGTANGLGVDYGVAGAGNLQVFDGTSWVDATTATIAAGDQFVQVRVPIVDDLIDEPTETYTLTVDVTGGTTTNIQVIGTGTIIDDDPVPDVTIDDAVAVEGDPLVFDVTLSNPSNQPIVLDFTASDTTATAATDYNATAFDYSTDGGVTWITATGGSEVTIPAGSTAIQVRVVTTEDVTLESSETMQLSIASVVSGLVGDTTDTAIGTIADDDRAMVSIVATDSVACEPSDHGEFTVTMSAPSDSPTVITYSVSGSATSGVDFVALSGTITLPAGVTSDTIDLTVLDDAIVEGLEDVTITLTSITSGDPQVEIDLANNSDTATIKDDDVVTWELTGDTNVNEGASANYNLSLAGTLQAGENTSIELTISDLSTLGSDYALFDTAVNTAIATYSGPGSLTWDGSTLIFTSDGTGQMAPLVIELMAVNDIVVEGVEEYNVSIANASSTSGVTANIDVVNNSVDTEIQDTVDAAGTSLDKASWSITGATSVSEASTTDYVVTIDATLQAGEIAEVDLSLTNVDTTAGDLTAINTATTTAVATYNTSGQPGTLSWDGTTLSFTSDGTGPMGDLVVQITANADGFLEASEDYSLSLSNPTSTTGACVDIAANDSVTTTITPDATAAEWSIGVDNGNDEGATIQYDVQLTESFGAGISAAVDLELNDIDTNSSDYGDFLTAVYDAIAAYTGPGMLTFDDTTLTFTATNDGDMMTGLAIDLGLIDDTLVEGTETFSVDLNNPAGTAGINVAVSTTDDSVTTTINDTIGVGGAPDTAIWSITGPAAGDEGTNAQYIVELDGALGVGESVSVVLGLTDIGTNNGDYASIISVATTAAAANSDVSFDPISQTFTYTSPSDGATMADLVIDLGLNTDANVEGPEDLELGLTATTSTTGAAVTIDPIEDSVTTTINDLTAPLVWAITGPVTADEGELAEYTITLDGALGAEENASVLVLMSDLTTNPSDYDDIDAVITAAISGNANLAYDPATGSLTFTAPADAATMPPLVIDLEIVNDSFVEGPEQYNIALLSPSSSIGAASTVSSTNGDVTTEINDTLGATLATDFAEWQLTGDTTVAENGTASYTLELVGQFGAGENALINIGLNNVDTTSTDYLNFLAAVNTAVAGYSGSGSVSIADSTITFTAANDGDSMSNLLIDVSAFDDTLVEGDEDYTVAISNASSTTGGTIIRLAATSDVTTTIIDNDSADWSITGDATVGEGSDAKYFVNLTGTLQAGETASIELAVGDTDTTSVDYANFVTAVNDAITAYLGPGALAFDGTTLTFTSDGSPMGDLCIELNAIDDAIVEGSEDYTVSIANPGSTTGSNLVTGGSTVVSTTINDDEFATWSISGDPTVNEGATAHYTVSLDGTLQAGETALIDIGLNDVDTNSADYANFVTAVISGVASRSDLTFDGTTLTYTGDGNPMADLIVGLASLDDTIAEGTEAYTIDLFDPNSTTGSNVAGTGLVTTAIEDNDELLWSITGSSNVDEGGLASYKVSLAGELQSGEQANVRLTLGDMETNSADYTDFISAVQTAVSTRTDLTFNAATGVLTVTGAGAAIPDLCIELTAADDTFIEGPERFQIMLADASSSTGLATGIDPTLSLVTTTINDTVNDGGPEEKAVWSLGFDQSVAEGDSGVYSLSLTGNFQAGEIASVDIGLLDIDTTSSDYEALSDAFTTALTNYAGPGSLVWNGTSLTFTSDGIGPMSTLSISLGTNDDGFAEGPEDFLIAISNANSTTGAAVCINATNDGAVTTIDDTIGSGADDATWSLTGDVSVDEGGIASYTIALTGGIGAGERTSVNLSLANINTNGSDYANFDAAVAAAVTAYNLSGNPGTLSWDGTALTFEAVVDGDAFAGIAIDLSAQDDAFLEGAELYQITLSDSSSDTGLLTGINPVANIVITTIDDTVGDGGPPEPGGEWSLVGTPAVVEGEPIDYTIGLTGNLQAGETTTIEVTYSDLETSGIDYGSFNTAITTAVAVYNADPLNNGDLAWDGNFLTFTSDGTGPMSGLDFSVDSIDDLVVEGNERLNLSLANPTSSTGLSPSVSSTQSVAATTITDNDTATWSITGDATVGEGADAKYFVNLTGTLQAGEVSTVELKLSDINSIASDHEVLNDAMILAVSNYSGPGDVSWLNSTLTFTSDGTGPMADLQISLGTNNDAFAEGNEDFQIALCNPSSSTGAATSIDATADDVITTIDDTTGPGADEVVWQIVGDSAVDEGGTAIYTVSIANALAAGNTATVALSIGDIDTNTNDYENFDSAVAQAVTNYNSSSNAGSLIWDGTTLVFTAAVDGDTLAGLVIELDAADDSYLEGPEVYDITLANPSSTTGILVDVDPTLDQVLTTINDTEGDGGPAEQGGEWSLTGPISGTEGEPLTFTVGLTGNLQKSESTSVQLNIADIDTTGSDYSNISAAIGSELVAYNANPANPGTLSWDGTFLTFVSDGTGPMSDFEITISAIDDLLIEGDEQINLTLANPSSTTGLSPNLSPTDNSATTIIIDNDFPEWSIQGPTLVGEGTNATYVVSLDGVFQGGESVTVDLSISNIDTTSSDYGDFIAAVAAAAGSNPDATFSPTTGTLTYNAPADGATMADLTIELPINADGISEAPEDFNIALNAPTSSTGLTPTIDPTADDVTTTINGSPITNPNSGFTNINTPYIGNVLNNDSDPDGDVLAVTEVNGQPIGSPIVTDCGTVEMNPNGSFIFTPFPGFSGDDVFEYTVVDEFGNEEVETVTVTVNEAKIGSAKSVADALPNGDNFDLAFTIVVQNLGNVPLNNLTVLDDVSAQFGPALVATGTPTIQNFAGSGTQPTINSNWTVNTSQNLVTGGRLEIGSSFEITFTITIDPDAGVSAAGLGNQATVSGQGVNPDGTPMTDRSGNPIVATDVSDNGSDPDGENGNEDSADGISGNDVTAVLIADLGIAKAITGEPVSTAQGNYVVTYQVVVQNTGTVDLANLSLLEDLSTQFGTAFVDAGNLTLASSPESTGSSITVATASWDGESQIDLLNSAANNLLVVGDSFAVEFDVEIDPREVAGSVGNQVTGSGAAVDDNGNPLLNNSGNQLIATDLSDSGTDPGSANLDDPYDSGTSDDISQFTPPALPLSEISGFVFLDENGNGIADQGEGGIEGVEITLTGQDVFGSQIEFVTFTDTSGQYVFSGLNAGNYTLQQTQPSQFTDGLETGETNSTVGDDVISNIELGFGETLNSSRFGERLSGASGYPPSFPNFGPIVSSPISNLLTGYLASPGPIYSGIPINSNANPLSLDSNGPVSGGYVTSNTENTADCRCETVDSSCQSVDNIRVTNVDESPVDCGPDPNAPSVEAVTQSEGYDMEQQDGSKNQFECPVELSPPLDEACCIDWVNEAQECPQVRRSLLKRIANWLSR